MHLFYVLSGFLITGILLGVRESVDRAGALRAFYIRRALRIFPAFYLTLALIWWADLPLVRESVAWHAAYLSNVYTFVRGEWPGAISHFWSLAVEEQFYLVWPWLIVFAPRRWLVPAIVAAIIFAPLFRLWMGALGYKETMHAVLTPGCLDSLGVGALLAAVAGPGFSPALAPNASLKGVKASLKAGPSTAVWLCAVPWIAILIAEKYTAVPLPLVAIKQTLQAFVFGWLILKGAEGFSGVTGRVLSSAPVVYLGRISYGVYLAHGFAGAMAATGFALAGLAWPAPEPWRLIILCGVTVAAAALSWHVLERPLNALKSSRRIAALCRSPRRRFDVNHRVLDLRILRHDAILHHVRHAMCLVQAHRRVHPDMQIDEHMIG